MLDIKYHVKIGDFGEAKIVDKVNMAKLIQISEELTKKKTNQNGNIKNYGSSMFDNLASFQENRFQ